jgi:hypothetical protein
MDGSKRRTMGTGMVEGWLAPCQPTELKNPGAAAQGRSWVFVAGGPDNRGAVSAENSTAEGTL